MKLCQLFLNCPKEMGQIDIKGITDDSRKVEDGYLFVCLKGPISDGHDYAKVAEEAGAAAIICEKNVGVQSQIIVEDSHKAYAQICNSWFGNPTENLKIVGVTGTNGKTSVCFMLKHIFEFAGHKTGLIGTIQNMIGDEVLPSKNTTPGLFDLNCLFRKMADAGCEYVVMEVSSHSLDQRRVEGIQFEAGIFTNLTQDHLDYHKTMENYFKAKAKLFEKSKISVINADDEYGKKLASIAKNKIVTYSVCSDESTFSAKSIQYRPNGVDYELVGYGIIGRINIKTVGKFSVYNSMAAAVCAEELGFSISDITEALGKIKGVKGRAEIVPTGKDFTVIIDYAHTPDGLQNILSAFKKCEKNRLIVLFGCGGDRDKSKRAKMGAVAARLSDKVIVTSDNPRSEDPGAIISDILEGMKDIPTPYKVIENRVDAIKYAVANAKSGDIIVLAGKGHETYQILKNETIHLDEREVVAMALS